MTLWRKGRGDLCGSLWLYISGSGPRKFHSNSFCLRFLKLVLFLEYLSEGSISLLYSFISISSDHLHSLRTYRCQNSGLPLPSCLCTHVPLPGTPSSQFYMWWSIYPRSHMLPPHPQIMPASFPIFSPNFHNTMFWLWVQQFFMSERWDFLLNLAKVLSIVDAQWMDQICFNELKG